MRSDEAELKLREFASALGVELETVDTETLVRTMAAWYRDERAEDVDLSTDGDMLLFQWGTYSWRGAPEFEFDLTRQFIVEGLEDDDAFFQLSWTVWYEPSAETEAIGQGDRWCNRPDGLDDFLELVASSRPGGFARSRRPDRIEIHFGPAG